MGIHVMGNHWVLLLADVTNRNVCYVDSKNLFRNTNREFIILR